MRLLVVLSLLLCILVCTHQAGAEMQGVRLCGRAFQKAVVYTCGGSRWRRFFSEPDIGGLPSGEQNSLENLNIPGSDLTKRDMNTYLRVICCQVGCGKNELTYMC
ncbi:PREDICTED: relaxin-3-like [Cyprinodon variegatus]|uniref:Relaxin-3-like n=1 Tax=Cyprinodon variegatus TaxID=28743 RepID=A0A3Q2CUE5_CYPVA|nr:PREDICTED: relaxin-3-like [Cyprinodon variegatus]